MDLKALLREDFPKKSNKVLLDIINQLDIDNRDMIKTIQDLLDRQDVLFEIYDSIMKVLSERTRSQ